MLFKIIINKKQNLVIYIEPLNYINTVDTPCHQILLLTITNNTVNYRCVNKGVITHTSMGFYVIVNLGDVGSL